VLGPSDHFDEFRAEISVDEASIDEVIAAEQRQGVEPQRGRKTCEPRRRREVRPRFEGFHARRLGAGSFRDVGQK
jgi:hypothetical protein